MAPSNDHPPSDTWEDPERSLFCGAALPDGGAGFTVHIDGNPECRGRFEAWRARVREDIGGEWGG